MVLLSGDILNNQCATGLFTVITFEQVKLFMSAKFKLNSVGNVTRIYSRLSDLVKKLFHIYC
jgi:hypothetical protein